MRKALLGVALALWLAPTAHAAVRTRLLYASDWNGPTQIFAADPSGRKPVAQITFDRPPPCSAGLYPITCGFIDPTPAPDGRHIAFRTNGVEGGALFVANADGSTAHVLVPNLTSGDSGPGHATFAWSTDSRRIRYQDKDGDHVIRLDGTTVPGGRGPWRVVRREFHAYDETVVSPDGRWVAFADKRGIGVTNRRTNRTRVLAPGLGFNLAWAPDSKSLAYISGFMHFGTSRTGDVRVVTLNGKARTVVAAGSPYGGEIVSIAWTRPPAQVRYKRPAALDGIYAGGEVGRLAADATHVAFAACNSVYVWTPPAAQRALVDANPLGDTLCFPPRDRVQVYDLAIAGERVAWGRTGGGLIPRMEVQLERLDTSQKSVTDAAGTVVGGHYNGVGTLAGSAGLLVYSSWFGLTGSPTGDVIVTTQTISRVHSSECAWPCAIASWSGLGVPTDVDAGRIVVKHAFWTDNTWNSRRASLAVLDATGTELLSLPVDASAAQLSGPDLVVAVPGRLLDYDASTGELRRSWPLPSGAVTRDCRFWSGPDCLIGYSALEPPLVLQDLARGLAAYTFDAKLHVLRLRDGADSVIGYASEARFMDSGLVYADGSRVHLTPFMRLFR